MAVSKLFKSGNSIVMSIPDYFLDQLKLQKGDSVKISLATSDDLSHEPIIIITPVKRHEKSPT
jgi:antitoxin component of MazEF toxin-antitoxin module